MASARRPSADVSRRALSLLAMARPIILSVRCSAMPVPSPRRLTPRRSPRRCTGYSRRRACSLQTTRRICCTSWTCREPPMGSLSPRATTRTLTIFLQLLLRKSQQSPLVIAVEDLHWVDATSEAWLTALVDQLAGAPLLLATYRPGYRPPWLDKSYATQLALQPSRPRQSADRADHCGQRPGPRAVGATAPGACRREPVFSGGTRLHRPGAWHGAGILAHTGDDPGRPDGPHRPPASHGKTRPPPRRRHGEGRAALPA